MFLKNSSGSFVRGAVPVFANLVLKRILERKLIEAASVCRFANKSHLWAVLGRFTIYLQLFHAILIYFKMGI